jgi:uncharacterized RDD family membrane protein YckC
MRRLGLAVLGIGALVVSFSGGGEIGFSVESVNGIGHVSAGTSIRAIGAAFIILIAYLIAIDPEPEEAAGSPASTSRRAFGWFLDFLLSLAAISALVALLPLASEALATGHFQWQFDRDSINAMDWVLSLVGIALVFGGMAVYWGLPPVRGGQTIGQAVLGLRVVSTTDQPITLRKSLLRGLLQPFAPLLWLAHLFSSRRTYFHDDLAHVQVITTKVSRPRGLTSA